MGKLTIGPKLYEDVHGKLDYTPVKNRIIESKESKVFSLYMGYDVYLDYELRSKILEDTILSEIRKTKKVYNITNNRENFDIYKGKISDSIKGYIHLNYTNPKTEQFDYLNIPIEF
ncbi:hypothetical protein Q4566_14910 [Tamlana sp. 2_MG-2023]|uniref:hypothetical protein n=1 Tax=unclassified Tamlana TaxID=2614803 RepID=UPI0026E492F3|nr:MULTISPECIES: hypothetical protein [unclassified Tamlana]MDO6761500.1 hypothetical protein [Tamlana sp. 2_MG-2023]MDO6792325.1 hypothetical protein [Tamlana sp. 1_MG-2023]